MTGWPKSNAESKHIYCSLISIHNQLNIPHETMLSCSLLPKFPVQKFLMTHILIYHDTRQWKTSMVTLPPLQTEPHQGPHWHLTSTNCWSDDVVVNIPIQTLVFLPWLLFYKIIISQLKLGLSVLSHDSDGKKMGVVGLWGNSKSYRSGMLMKKNSLI